MKSDLLRLLLFIPRGIAVAVKLLFRMLRETVWGDEKVILDYGCGPGNDLVGFAHDSRPKRLIGIDISHTSLSQAEERLRLHDASADFLQMPYGVYDIPLESESVDYVHCSGVLMLI